MQSWEGAIDTRPISPKNPTPQYQPIENKNRMERAAQDKKKHWPCS